MDAGTLINVFSQTFSVDPAPRKQAEEYLKQAALQPGYTASVVTLVAQADVPEQVRLAAAVNIKNHVKFHWVASEEDGSVSGPDFVIPDAEKAAVKQNIVGVMLAAPPLVQAQVSETLALISASDFPSKWTTLLPELVARLNSAGQDYGVINGVLSTANIIFKRYRNAFRSDDLYTELNYVFTELVTPMKELLKRTSAAIALNPPPEVAKQLLMSIRLICRVFYSLHSHDLPEPFEDTLAEWMAEFHNYLNYENDALKETDMEKESVVDMVKTAICENINLYIEKFEEEFESYLGTFVQDVWSLLMKVGLASNTDRLAATAIRFLTTVCKSVHSKLFGEEATLKNIVESIVIPNLQIREEDEELFDMNHVEYIRRDIEGSDSDTRRRMACELVKGLTTKFPEFITTAVSGHVSSLLAVYATDPVNNWKAKDCAIYLVVALTVRGATSAKGATTVNSFVNVGEFFAAHIQPEVMTGAGQGSAFLKADALKFITTFRSQIPKDMFVAMLPNVVGLLAHESSVVHSYAAHCIERMLMVKDAGQPRFVSADLAPVLTQLLTNLFGAFTLGDSAENEYLMKCLMRVVSFMGPEIKVFATQCQSQIVNMLVEVAKNPRNPAYNHYLFETVAGLVKHSCQNDPHQCTSFEGLLFPPFQHILEMDVTEFAPYVFQILSQLLEIRPLPLPVAYMALFPPLLSPVLWERSGNVPALVRLLQAYLQKAHSAIIQGNHLPAILGVFQKLAASKNHDHEGFYVLNTLVEFLDPAALAPFMAGIWGLLFTRLQGSKTPKFVRSLTVFIGLFASKHGVNALEDSIAKVQPGLFLQLLQGVVLGALTTVHGDMEKKICAVGFGKVLCSHPALLAQPAVWGKTLEALVVMLERPEPEGGDDLDAEVDEAPGYTAAFAQLHHSSKVESDPIVEVKDPKQFLCSQLAQISAQQPLSPVIKTLPQEVQQALMGYCQLAGVAIQ